MFNLYRILRNVRSLQITELGSRISQCVRPASGHQGRVCLDAGLAGQTAPREAFRKATWMWKCCRWQGDCRARKGPHSGRPTRVLRREREMPGLDPGGFLGLSLGTGVNALPPQLV